MLIWTARLSKKRAVLMIIALGAVMAALICLFAGRQQPKPAATPQLLTNADRVTYLCSFGWEVEPEPLETLQFLLPDTLEEPYLTYNDLQKSQGFELSACCGKQVARYTYAVTNYPGRAQGVQANLYVCGDRPAAGDIFCAGADGFQTGLAFPKS